MPSRATAIGSVALAVLLCLPAGAFAETLVLGKTVVMRGAAVAETPTGFVGSTASFSITAATNGAGHIFLDTFPLTQVDMQGSARLAARVASQITGIPLSERDLFFVIRSDSTQIGGPSAGATLTVGTIAALEGWDVRSDVLMTGTINPDGSVGPVGGVPEKARAAAEAGIKRFMFPAGEEQTKLSATGATIDLPAYCRTQLALECVPVNDVYEAVANMTDHRFERPAVTGNVTGQEFQAKLGPLSVQLVDQARKLYDAAMREVAQTPAGASRRALDAELATAKDTLDRATSASANGTYYTAASLSFQSSIAAHDARDRAIIARAADPAAAIASVVEADAAAVASARGEIQGRAIEDTSSFETVGAAQVRLLEAESRLARAQALVRNGTDTSAGLNEATYAAERAATAVWWLKLGEGAPAGTRVESAALREAARDTITTGEEQVAYVQAVFAQANIGTALDAAQANLAEANVAMQRGFFGAAMLDSLEAQVRSSNVMLLASFGSVPPARLEQARVEAARSIQEARGRGVEPILAESEYEFGGSLESPADALTFYGLARVAANLAGLPNLFGQAQRAQSGVATRFQGIPATLGVAPSWVAASFAVGLALGAGAGLVAMLPATRRAKRAAPPPVGASREEIEAKSAAFEQNAW